MATPAEVLAAIASRVVIVTASAAVRSTSDYRDDVEAIPPGETRFQLRGVVADVQPDSNVSRGVMACEIVLRHRLADPTDERVYTEGNLQLWVGTLVRRATWAAETEIFALDEEPEVDEVERLGNVIVATIQLRPIIGEIWF